MASRSTVSTPVAVTRAAAWFVSGESRVPCGMDLGSGAMFMPHFRRRNAAIQPQFASIAAVGQVAILREIAEARELAFELYFHGAGGAVALLADDDFGLAVHQRHVELPFFVFGRADTRLLIGEVIFLAIHEEHDVSVLLDRTGFAQVGQLRPLVVTVFNLTRELRQGDDRNIELLGERLEIGG